MSKVVYLMGAGASYGKREKDSNGKDILGRIIEGLPTVNEIPMRLEMLKEAFTHHSFSKEDILENEHTHASVLCRKCQEKLTEDTLWLIENTRKHATIDTFAKKLFLTGQTEDYTRLKRLLSVFFKTEQLVNPPDRRYDSFLASVVQLNSQGKLRISEDISVLTWNYDSQFEIAYFEYLSNGIYKEDICFPYQLGIDIHSEISNSVKLPSYPDNGERQIFKLNGSATFDAEFSIFRYFHNYHRKLDDKLIRTILKTYAVPFYRDNEVQRCMLNFAWDTTEEYDAKTNYKNRIENAINDAVSLVIIGYSFPFFNREMDSFLFSKMKSLKHIYIQDPNADNIKETIINRFPINDSQITLKKDVSQFFLPPEL